MIYFHAELFISMECLPDIQVVICQKTVCAMSPLARVKGWQLAIMEGWPYQREQGNGTSDLRFSPVPGLTTDLIDLILAWEYWGQPCGLCHLPII